MHDLVAEDLKDRSEFGRRKYGTNLRAFNGRDPLKDAYEEVLDLAVYLRQLMFERDKRGEWLKEHEQPLQQVNPFRTQQMTLFDDPDKTAVLYVDWKE